MDFTIINKNDYTIFPTKKRMDSLYGSKKTETLGEMLIRRNNQIINMFSDYDVELYGKAESPMIVLNRGTKLAAYVHNFELRFIDGNKKKDNVLQGVKINFTNKIDPVFFAKFIINYPHEDWAEVVKKFIGKKYHADEIIYKGEKHD